jgi:hypothetical protein
MTAATKDDVKDLKEMISKLFDVSTANGKSIVRLETEVANIKSVIPKQPCDDAKKVDMIEKDVEALKKEQDETIKRAAAVGLMRYKTHAAVVCCVLSPFVAAYAQSLF